MGKLFKFPSLYLETLSFMLCVYHLFIEISELDHHHHHQVFVVTNIKEKINGGIDKEVPFT